MTEKEILAKVIIEVVGAPKEHVEKAVDTIIERISKNNLFRMIKKSTFNAEKIEQKELIFQSDPDPLLEGYFDEVRQRTFRPRTDADVEKAASLELSGEPLTQLTEQELERLGIYLRKNLQVRKIHVNTIYRALIEDPIYWIKNELVTKERLDKKNNTPLKPEELIKLLANPEVVYSTRYVNSQGSTMLTGDGSRHLYARDKEETPEEDNYGYSSAEDFNNILKRIKQRTKKQKLTMLDMGGNVGQALMDAKNIDSTLKTINITLKSETVVSGDIVVRRPAEYMPSVFEESIDLIESNYSFRYFLFPDIALKNTVKALSIGGETNLDFTNDSCPLDKEELLKRMKNIFAWLAELEQKGYIEVVRKGSDPFLVKEAYFWKTLQIIKKKSTTGL